MPPTAVMGNAGRKMVGRVTGRRGKESGDAAANAAAVRQHSR